MELPAVMPIRPAPTGVRIEIRPAAMSASFHGRDLFAPVAARLALGEPPPGRPVPVERIRRPDWPDDLDRIVEGVASAVGGAA